MKYPDNAIFIFIMVATLSVSVIFFQLQNVMQSRSGVEKKRSEFLSSEVAAYTSLEDSRFLETTNLAFERILHRNSAVSKRKIEWIKLLKTAQAQLNLAEMSFEIHPPRSVTSSRDDLWVAVGVEFIELKLSLVHDGKLSELLSYLNTYAPNEFIVSKIEINRVERDINNGITTPKIINLEVRCTVKWYSIDMVGEDSGYQS